MTRHLGALLHRRQKRPKQKNFHRQLHRLPNTGGVKLVYAFLYKNAERRAHVAFSTPVVTTGKKTRTTRRLRGFLAHSCAPGELGVLVDCHPVLLDGLLRSPVDRRGRSLCQGHGCVACQLSPTCFRPNRDRQAVGKARAAARLRSGVRARHEAAVHDRGSRAYHAARNRVAALRNIEGRAGRKQGFAREKQNTRAVVQGKKMSKRRESG